MACEGTMTLSARRIDTECLAAAMAFSIAASEFDDYNITNFRRKSGRPGTDSAFRCRCSSPALTSSERRKTVKPSSPPPASTIPPSSKPQSASETALPGWACRTRTGESVRELSDWKYVTTSHEVGAGQVAETLRVRAAWIRICSSGQDFR